MLHKAYLFDVAGFRRLIAPIVAQLAQNDVALLRATAVEVAAQNPRIWPLLAPHRLAARELRPVEAAGAATDRDTNLWMMILLAHFWQPLAALRASLLSGALLTLLHTHGWSIRELNWLLAGNAQRALLQPELVADPLERPTDPAAWPAWCWFGQLPQMTGWLDLADVRALRARLAQIEESPDALEAPAAAAYQAVGQMLSTAEQARTGLFLTATD